MSIYFLFVWLLLFFFFIPFLTICLGFVYDFFLCAVGSSFGEFGNKIRYKRLLRLFAYLILSINFFFLPFCLCRRLKKHMAIVDFDWDGSFNDFSAFIFHFQSDPFFSSLDYLLVKNHSHVRRDLFLCHSNRWPLMFSVDNFNGMWCVSTFNTCIYHLYILTFAT